MASAINVILSLIDDYSSQITGLNQGLELVGKTLSGLKFGASLVTGGFGLLFDAASSLASIAFAPLTAGFDILYGSVIAVKNAVVSLFGYLYDAMKAAAGYVWDAIKSISGFMYDSFKETIDYLFTSIKDLGVYALTVTKDIAFDFGQDLFDTGIQFEQLKVRMEAVFGGQGPAKAALDWATTFGAKTPLTIDKVASAMVKLKVYGFDPMGGIMTKLGDASLALGVDMESVIDALGRMQLKGKVSARELLSLTVNNIPAYEILKEKFNLTADQLANIGNAGLDAGEAIDAIVENIGTKYSGAMRKMSNQTVGALSTIDDAWTVFRKQINDVGIWDVVTAQTVRVRDFLSDTLGGSLGTSLARSFNNAFLPILRSLGSKGYFEEFFFGMVKVVNKVLQDLKSLTPQLLSIFDTIFTEGLKAYQFLVSTVGEVFKIFTPLVKELLKYLPDVNKTFITMNKTTLGVLKRNMPAAIKLVSGIFKDVVDFIKLAVKQTKEWANSVEGIAIQNQVVLSFQQVYNYLKEMGKALFSVVTTTVNWGTVWEKVKSGAQTLWDAIKYVGKEMYKIAVNTNWTALWDYTWQTINEIKLGLSDVFYVMRKIYNSSEWYEIWGFTLEVFSETVAFSRYLYDEFVKILDTAGGIEAIMASIGGFFKTIKGFLPDIKKLIVNVFDLMIHGIILSKDLLQQLFVLSVKGFKFMVPAIISVTKSLAIMASWLTPKKLYGVLVFDTTYILNEITGLFSQFGKAVGYVFEGTFNFIKEGARGLFEPFAFLINKIQKLRGKDQIDFGGLFDNAQLSGITDAMDKRIAETKRLREAIAIREGKEVEELGIKAPDIDFAPIEASFNKLTDGLTDSFKSLKEDFTSIADFGSIAGDKLKIPVKLEIEALTPAQIAARKKELIDSLELFGDFDLGRQSEKLKGLDKDFKLGKRSLDVDINVKDGELDKLKSEMIISLRKDDSVIQSINENEMLVALTKILIDTVVNTAQGEDTPLVYS